MDIDNHVFGEVLFVNPEERVVQGERISDSVMQLSILSKNTDNQRMVNDE